MSWGIGLWGSTPWGGSIVLVEEMFEKVSMVNQRPYPPDVVVSSVTASGVNDLQADTDLADIDGLFDGHVLLTLYGDTLYERSIVSYVGRTITLDKDLPTPLPAGGGFAIIAQDTWVSDRLYLAIRQGILEKVPRESIDIALTVGNLAFDLTTNLLKPGNPNFEHEGVLQSGSSFETLLLDTNQLTPSAWVGEDHMKGLAVTVLQGAERGKTARVSQSSGGTVTVYPPFKSATLTGLAYRLHPAIKTSFVPKKSLPTDKGVIDCSPAGLKLDSTASPTNSLLYMEDPWQGLYNFRLPILLNATFYCSYLEEGSSGFLFGFQQRTSRGHFSASVVFRESGGSAWAYIYDRDDIIGSVDLGVTNLDGRILDIYFSYSPKRDALLLSVFQVFPLPAQRLVNSFEIPNASQFGVDRPSFAIPVSGNVAFFGAVSPEDHIVLQVLQFSSTSLGVEVVRDGKVQGIPLGDLTPSTPLVSSYDRDPIYWSRPWRPKTLGGRDTPDVEVVSEPLGGFKMTRVENSKAPLMYTRVEPVLCRETTSGFLLRLRCTVDVLSTDGIHTGVSLGAAVGVGPSLRYLHIALLRELGDFIGLQIGQPGEILDEYLHAPVSLTSGLPAQREGFWNSREVELTVVYVPLGEDRPGYLAVFAGGEREPLLLSTGPQLIEALQESNPLSPIDKPGFFFGLSPRRTEVSMKVPKADYLCNCQTYHPGIDTVMPTQLPTRPWEVPIGDIEMQGVGYDRRTVIFPQTLMYLPLDLDSAGVEGWLSPEDGCAIEIRLRVEDGSQEDVGEFGVWSGAAIVIDDGEERVWLGFGHAGAFGRVMYIPYSLDLQGRFTSDYMQTFIEKITQDTGACAGSFHQVDWTSEMRLRVERVRSGTLDRMARIRVFLNDMLSPVLDVQYERGLLGESSEPVLGYSLPASVCLGSFVVDRNASLRVGETHVSVSSGFDVSVDRLLEAQERLKEMVSPNLPAKAGLFTDIEE